MTLLYYSLFTFVSGTGLTSMPLILLWYV